MSDKEAREIFQMQLGRPISSLDLTVWQLTKLNEIGLKTIQELLAANVDTLIDRINCVGKVRARQMMNAAYAAMMEYLSG